MPPPLVLTLALDAVSFTTFDTLRRQHFPPDRNWLTAHLTLFHALPGAEEASIVEVLEEQCRSRSCMVLRVSGVRFLGRGIAYEVHSKELERLREELAASWNEWLTPQDRQGFRAHVTIQNKASPEAARALYEELSSKFIPWEAYAGGLLLWRYLGGPWELVREIPFATRAL